MTLTEKLLAFIALAQCVGLLAGLKSIADSAIARFQELQDEAAGKKNWPAPGEGFCTHCRHAMGHHNQVDGACFVCPCVRFPKEE